MYNPICYTTYRHNTLQLLHIGVLCMYPKYPFISIKLDINIKTLDCYKLSKNIMITTFLNSF